jgi:hypothetical protein
MAVRHLCGIQVSDLSLAAGVLALTLNYATTQSLLRQSKSLTAERHAMLQCALSTQSLSAWIVIIAQIMRVSREPTCRVHRNP